MEEILEKIKKFINKSYFNRYFDWFLRKMELVEKSEQLDQKRKTDSIHPVQPRKGDIYLIEFGQNIGTELSNTHMGIIVQSSSKNVVTNTVIVVPISSSKKLYNTHEVIREEDIKEGKLNKLPSKAKAEQLTCVDKARLVHKVGSVTDNFMMRLEKRILKNLDIKQ
jgi:mRNA-degrading endonuclease toxin of MazEF toxin-antitoxin module